MPYTQRGSLVRLAEEALLAADDTCRDIAEAAGIEATRMASDLAPFAHPFGSRLSPPGELKRSYTTIEPHRTIDPLRAARGWVSGVQSSDPVAHWIEYGVRAHDVSAKPGKWLRFRTTEGKWITAKLVHQKGYVGRHVVSRALAATEATLPDIAAPAVEAWKLRSERAAE